MLVDATQHAGPARFQGLGLISVVIWGALLSSAKDDEQRKIAHWIGAALIAGSLAISASI